MTKVTVFYAICAYGKIEDFKIIPVYSLFHRGDGFLYNFEETKDFLRGRLSKKRYTHCVNVAFEARQLAEIFGADTDKAYFAALLHDVCKEIPFEQQREMVVASSQAVSRTELSSRPLWHAIAGAYFAKHNLGVDDLEVLNAIRFHTIGRAGMSKIEEIVYLADLISVDRTYKDVRKMKKLAYTDLDLAMLEALRFAISSILEKSGYIPNYTIEAYNQYLFVCEQKKHDKT